jgi:hypothetical protein
MQRAFLLFYKLETATIIFVKLAISAAENRCIYSRPLLLASKFLQTIFK